MPGLKDLQVDWISFVDRAAVRDPINQSEPARFLLCKREGADAPSTDERTRQMTPQTDIPGRTPVGRALAAAREALEPYLSDARIAEVDRRIGALADAYADDQTAGSQSGENDISKSADRLAHSLVDVAKAQADAGVAPDDLLGRERMAKGSRAAQAEYLAQMSPAGSAAYEAARAA